MATTASPVREGVAPLRAGQGISFFLRRLHSLTGIIPVGAFLFESKITQSATLPPGSVREDLVNQAFQELGLDPTKALFQLPGASKNPFKGDNLVK